MGNDKSSADAILATLREQKEQRIERGFYWENQVAFVYNSEKMEGNPLSKDETRAIFETRTVKPHDRSIPLDHLIETKNHFRLFDEMLSTVDEPLSKELICRYHRILKRGTSGDDPGSGIAIGSWKTIPNEIAGKKTTEPKHVDAEMDRLIKAYEGSNQHDLRSIAGLHVFFENIHPFQDGNGRVGRILMFKESLRHGLEPFIVLDEHKRDYYSGLQLFETDEEPLLEHFDAMRELYMREYSALIPEWHLLPRFEEFIDRDARSALLDDMGRYFK